MIRYFISSITACENPPLHIVATFRARHMADCSSWTQPPCLGIVAQTLKTDKKVVAASNNEIRLLLQPYTLPYPLLARLMRLFSTLGDAYDEILQ